MTWYLAVLKKYAVFQGRARRREFWMFSLWNVVVALVLAVLDVLMGIFSAAAGLGLLSGLYGLATAIPSLAVTVRRLHDTNRSGWWLFITLVPFVGAIALLVFVLQNSQAEENQYGPNPKMAAA